MGSPMGNAEDTHAGSQHANTPPAGKRNAKTAAKSSHEFLNAEEWFAFETAMPEDQIVFGSTDNVIVGTQTKNLIEAPEKAFKTTFMLRLMLALSCGKTVFPKLPVLRPRKVLYVHGELALAQIKERTIAAGAGLPRPLKNFTQGKDLRIHLILANGQRVLRDLIDEFRPEDVVLDPWQSFITGFDENEYKDVSKATRFLDEMIERFGVTVYIPTHMGKDHSRGTRGHSSLGGWRDTRFKLDKKKELVTVNIEPRWAAPVEPFALEFRDGTVWSSARNQFGKQIDDIRRFVQARDGVCTRKEIAVFMRRNGDALRKALRRAEDANAIVVDGECVRLRTHEDVGPSTTYDENEPSAVDLLWQ